MSMIDQREYSPVKETFTVSGLQRAIKSSWEESSTSNLDRLTRPELRAVITLCPLYKPGTLDQSRILHHDDASVDVSRVANKWTAVQKVLGGIKEYVQTMNGSLALTAIFANKGILFNGEPEKSDYLAVERHDSVYRQVLNEFCKDKGVDLTYKTYDDLGVSFPRFVNPYEEPPEIMGEGVLFQRDESKLIGQLNMLTRGLGTPVEVVDNKKNREVVGKLQDVKGISRNGAFWVIAGYLAFDYQLPSLIGNNGLYIATERFEPHFGITSMTPGLRDIPKIKLKA